MLHFVSERSMLRLSDNEKSFVSSQIMFLKTCHLHFAYFLYVHFIRIVLHSFIYVIRMVAHWPIDLLTCFFRSFRSSFHVIIGTTCSTKTELTFHSVPFQQRKCVQYANNYFSLASGISVLCKYLNLNTSSVHAELLLRHSILFDVLF